MGFRYRKGSGNAGRKPRTGVDIVSGSPTAIRRGPKVMLDKMMNANRPRALGVVINWLVDEVKSMEANAEHMRRGLLSLKLAAGRSQPLTK